MITDTTKTKLISVIILGVCDALKNNAIDISEAERLLFSPHVMNSGAVTDPRLIEAIHMGTELDDLQDIVPGEYEATLDRIHKLAINCIFSLSKDVVIDQKHWIDVVCNAP